ncbi:MAG: hypothetical protein K0R66_1464 [Gammaproteobacteria bacterium]|jgi:TolA-binding protein|nr:hypothetical protein [Gammaproteobacteria bacterium]
MQAYRSPESGLNLSREATLRAQVRVSEEIIRALREQNSTLISGLEKLNKQLESAKSDINNLKFHHTLSVSRIKRLEDNLTQVEAQLKAQHAAQTPQAAPIRPHTAGGEVTIPRAPRVQLPGPPTHSTQGSSGLDSLFSPVSTQTRASPARPAMPILERIRQFTQKSHQARSPQ